MPARATTTAEKPPRHRRTNFATRPPPRVLQEAPTSILTPWSSRSHRQAQLPQSFTSVVATTGGSPKSSLFPASSAEVCRCNERRAAAAVQFGPTSTTKRMSNLSASRPGTGPAENHPSRSAARRARWRPLAGRSWRAPASHPKRTRRRPLARQQAAINFAYSLQDHRILILAKSRVAGP